MPDRVSRGLLDTSVVIDLENVDASALPLEVSISVVTLAELSAGPAATSDLDERARRQDRLQRTEAVFDPPPVDVEAAPTAVCMLPWWPAVGSLGEGSQTSSSRLPPCRRGCPSSRGTPTTSTDSRNWSGSSMSRGAARRC